MGANTVLRHGPRRTLGERLLAPLRAVGEISLLRRAAWFGGFGFFTPYTLDSSRVSYELARALYRNTEDRYKLGAGFAKPIINTTAGFMGVPTFTHEDEDADQALEVAMARHGGTLLRLTRNVLRDGDVFARWDAVADRFTPEQRTLQLRLVPPEWVTPVLDPVTGGWREVVIRYPVQVTDADGRQVEQYTITETLTAARRTVEADNRAPQETRAAIAVDEPNAWGFIPIVHFRNEAEEHQLYGCSDLEPVEPFLRAYHDLLLSLLGGAKLFGRPKVKFQLKDLGTFLANNFTAEERKAGKLSFQGKELFFVNDGEDITFVTAASGIEDIVLLLEYLFYCIVQVSETPEFALGTAVSSSKASVSEQQVPLTKKIARKRGQLEEPYGALASMYLAMWAKLENRTLPTLQTAIEWGEVTERDGATVATTIKTLVEGLLLAIEGNLMSVEAGAERLRQEVPTMLPWTDPDGGDDERRRVAKSVALLRQLQDAAGGNEPDPADEDGGDPPQRGRQPARRAGTGAATGAAA